MSDNFGFSDIIIIDNRGIHCPCLRAVLFEVHLIYLFIYSCYQVMLFEVENMLTGPKHIEC